MSSIFQAVEWPFGMAAATAVGAGVAPVVLPQVQGIVNTAWTDAAKNGRGRPPQATVLALGVAQGQIPYGNAEGWAADGGTSPDVFAALVDAANVGPGMAQAYRLWRRTLIDKAGFYRALKRVGLEAEWIDDLWNARQEPLDPSVLAAGIVRGLVPDPGILPVGPPGGAGVIKPFPVFNVDALAEAQAAGLDKTHLSVLVGNYGRPMSPEAAASAYFRSLIELDDFYRAIAESDVRNEWRDAILAAQRFIPSITTAAGLQLRGWLDEAAAQEIADWHGADVSRKVGGYTMLELEYLNRGRPATPRQVHLGYARGAFLPGYEKDEEGAITRAVQESDIRTEWRDIEAANRWSYPSPFVLRQLTGSGAFTADETYQILIEMGWKPQYARAAADAWATPATAGATTWAPRAATQLWNATHKAYLKGEIDDALARSTLSELPVRGADLDSVMRLWDAERSVTRAELTAAEIRREYRHNIITEAQAMAELEERGYTINDAAKYLA